MPRKTIQDLDSVGRRALREWKDYRPNLVGKLEQKGQLYDHLVEMQNNVTEMIDVLLQRGVPLIEATNRAMREYLAIPDLTDDPDEPEMAESTTASATPTS